MKFQTQQLFFKPMSNSGNIITEIMQISQIKWSTVLTIAIFNYSALILKSTKVNILVFLLKSISLNKGLKHEHFNI